MRAGLIASVAAHAALITFGLISLQGAEPLEPEDIESINIDLVPVEAFSNIRIGTEQSDVIETETPAVVDTPEPAQLAERTGNTEEDQPNPLDTDNITPAPTVQTAPEPEALPEPEPEPVIEQPAVAEPEPEPEALPEPTPEPEPAPVTPTPELAVEPDETAEPAEPAPQPVIRTASIDRKRAEFKRQQEEEARRRAEERERQKAEEAKEADRISDIINDEESRGGTTGSGGQATAGREDGQAARLTQSERDALVAQMRKCFNPPLSATVEDSARLLVELNRDGSVVGTPRILVVAPTPQGDPTARAAQRAVMRCGPYQLAAEKYEEWRQIDVTFDPSQIL